MTWRILGDAPRDPQGRRRVFVQCSCGTVTDRDHYQVKSGQSKSCGCSQVTHHHARAVKGKPSPTYISWQAMRTRCLNTRAADYGNYGGRGITIDPAWDSFEQFLADMGERPGGMTLDRRDVDGPYNKSNCRWADASVQRKNQRSRRCYE